MIHVPRRDRKIPPPFPWLGLILPILGMAFINNEQVIKLNTPAPFVIREAQTDLLICAEYRTADTSGKPNRSCVPAGSVAGWILQNGREDCP